MVGVELTEKARPYCEELMKNWVSWPRKLMIM
jgi:hypothetical protein